MNSYRSPALFGHFETEAFKLYFTFPVLHIVISCLEDILCGIVRIEKLHFEDFYFIMKLIREIFKKKNLANYHPLLPSVVVSLQNKEKN